MTLESFAKLKEYDSLNKMRAQHLKNIDEQQERLSKLSDKQNANQQNLKDLKSSHLKLQDELAEVEKKIKIAGEQKQRLLDMGGDEKKIQLFQDQMSELETHGLELLEKLELNEQEREEAKVFDQGIQQTISEIAEEVKAESDKEKVALKNIELRLQSVTDELPDEFKSLLQKILTKKLAHGPFTRIDNGSCFFCRYKLSRLDESEIDMQKMIKTCPQCTRLFIPYGT